MTWARCFTFVICLEHRCPHKYMHITAKAMQQANHPAWTKSLSRASRSVCSALSPSNQSIST